MESRRSKKHAIDPNRLAKTFQIKWRHPSREDPFFPIGKKGKVDRKTYNFILGEEGKEKSMVLSISHDRPRVVSILIEAKNGYQSSIDFGNLTEVIYIPKYRAVRLESNTKTHFSILKIYWRGQFDLSHGLPEGMYSKTIWAKRKDY